MAETRKAFERRLREGWFEKYAPEGLAGIDIGCQHDPLNHTFRRWDYIFGDGDATFMEGVPDDSFSTTYISHVLEHLDMPVVGVRHWHRITKPGGHLIICVPSVELYEKKRNLPSLWNGDHKTFWVKDYPAEGDPEHFRGLRQVIEQAIPNPNIVLLRMLDEGWESNGPNKHSGGEYSIEAIVRKKT